MTDKKEPEARVIIVSSKDTMREPTNLELAQFFSLQSNYNTALHFLFHMSHDLMSEDEDIALAQDGVQHANAEVMFWWGKLLYDNQEEDEDAE